MAGLSGLAKELGSDERLCGPSSGLFNDEKVQCKSSHTFRWSHEWEHENAKPRQSYKLPGAWVYGSATQHLIALKIDADLDYIIEPDALEKTTQSWIILKLRIVFISCLYLSPSRK